MKSKMKFQVGDQVKHCALDNAVFQILCGYEGLVYFTYDMKLMNTGWPPHEIGKEFSFTEHVLVPNPESPMTPEEWFKEAWTK